MRSEPEKYPWVQNCFIIPHRHWRNKKKWCILSKHEEEYIDAPNISHRIAYCGSNRLFIGLLQAEKEIDL